MKTEEKKLLHHLTEAERLLAENGMEADADTLHEVQKRVRRKKFRSL